MRVKWSLTGFYFTKLLRNFHSHKNQNFGKLSILFTRGVSIDTFAQLLTFLSDRVSLLHSFLRFNSVCTSKFRVELFLRGIISMTKWRIESIYRPLQTICIVDVLVNGRNGMFIDFTSYNWRSIGISIFFSIVSCASDQVSFL